MVDAQGHSARRITRLLAQAEHFRPCQLSVEGLTVLDVAIIEKLSRALNDALAADGGMLPTRIITQPNATYC